MTSCSRHGSHGLFGAIREDNVELVQHFLKELKPNLVDVFQHETRFGDTILSYSALHGRSEIIRILLRAVESIVEKDKDALSVPDLVDYESRRGKVAIIEAARNNKVDTVSILLYHQANANLRSKTHLKSAMDWAIILGHETIVGMIDEHTKLEERALCLFKSVTKFDTAKVEALTEGGVPFQRNQDAMFRQELESKRRLVDEATRSEKELLSSSHQIEQSKAETHRDVLRRAEHIEGLVKRRNEIVSRRKSEVATVTAEVRLAVTASNVDNVCNAPNPPLEYELISKSLCTLLHIKVKRAGTPSDSGSMVHWEAIKDALQDTNRFYHRIRHFHAVVEHVESAAKVGIEGLPGTCFDHLASMMKTEGDLGSVLMMALVHWLWTIFQQVDGHKQEHEHVMQESAESDLLERDRIDLRVLTSRGAILKRELDDVAASLKANTKQVSQLEKKLEVSKVMRYVAGGHTILSWAAGAGNEEIVKVLLKRGAHTAIGEDCIGWCATIVQVAFRRTLERKDFHRTKRFARESHERLKLDFVVSMRIKSLSNLIRERLRRIRLPLAEALFNGHSNVAMLLDGSDVPLFQAMNLFPLFGQPRGTIPRHPGDATSNDHDYLSALILGGEQCHHEQDPRDCGHVDSMKRGVDMFETFLRQKRKQMEAKISTRRATLYTKHRNAMASELTSALRRSDFPAVVLASESGNISQDFEDPATGLTPLIRAAMEDVHSPIHVWHRNAVGEPVTAVAYLLDRISPHRPSVDYENRRGHTALAMACMHGRVEAIRDLLDRGADVDRQSTLLKCTAYDLAVEENQHDVIECLDKLRSSGK
ncbi:hypothetical protein ACHAWF_014118 [Thalassiosira exigua]